MKSNFNKKKIHKRNQNMASKNNGELQIYPLTKDIVFKAFFTNLSNKDLLLDFLNHYLDLNIKNISDIEILNPELSPKHVNDKSPRLDLRVVTKNNEHINIEIQVKNTNDLFINRSIYYISKLLSDQLIKSRSYGSLGKVISLNILNFNIFDSNHYLSHYTFRDCKTFNELSDIMQIYFLELKKYNKISKSKDLWTALFNTNEMEVLDMLKTKSKIMGKAVESLVKISQNERIRFMIDMQEKAEHDYITDMEYNQKIGFEEGVEEGIEKGSKDAKIEMAKNLLDSGFDYDTIKKITNLSDELLMEIKEKL